MRIEKCIKKEVDMDVIYKDFIKVSSKEGKNIINKYINNVVKIVKDEIKEEHKKYKEIYFNMQTNNIIIRNIKVLNISNKKDIEAMIEFELTQYIPIDIKDYVLKYKVLSTTVEEITVQAILMPNYMVDICREISSMLNMKPKELCLNFDILQKIITLGLVKDYKDSSIYIENKHDEFILNKVKDKIILETYILPKTHQSYQTIEKFKEEYHQIYYYGIEDSNIINQFRENHKLYILDINKEISVLKDETYNKCENAEHINCIGMVI